MNWFSRRGASFVLIVCGGLCGSLQAQVWEFAYTNHFQGLGRCDDVAVADFNGDGKNDVVFSTGHLFLNQGGSPPQWEHQSGVFDESMGMWVGDLDSDGDMDIFAPKKEGAGYFVENTDGQGTTWQKHVIFAMPEELAEESRVLDINKDGRDDIAVLLRSGGPLYLLLQPADAKTAWPSYNLGGAGGDEGTLDFGDIDADGDIDLFAQGFWYENDGTVAKNNWTRHSHPASAHKQRLGDIDKDGSLDIVDGGRILFGPSFTRSQTMGSVPASVYLHGLMPVDFDGDGDLDVFVGSMSGSQPPYPPVTIFENADAKGGQWVQHAMGASGAAHNGWCADLNGDARVDIVGKHWASDKSGFEVWYNTLGPVSTVPFNIATTLQQGSISRGSSATFMLNGRVLGSGGGVSAGGVVQDFKSVLLLPQR